MKAKIKLMKYSGLCIGLVLGVGSGYCRANEEAEQTVNAMRKQYEQRRKDFIGEQLKQRDFILGTAMRPPLDMSAWPIGSTQSWHHGLIIEGDETDTLDFN